MKKTLFLILILLSLLSFAAVRADDLADVKQAGTLRLGISPEYIPFVFYGDDGKLTGIDVALMDEIGRRMGVKIEPVNMAFEGLFDSLDIGQVDVIGGALSKTESRMEKIDFTRVYYVGDAEFIGLASLLKPDTVELSDFRDLRIGVQKGTSFDQWIKTNLVGGGYVSVRNVYTYASATDAMKALDRMEVDLVLLDQDVYEDQFLKSGRYQVFYQGFAAENYAFGLRKGSTLTAAINEHLTSMLKDGTAQQIADRFFSMNFDEAETTIARPSQIATPTPAVPVIEIPTQAPAAETCKNGMVYAADITVPDGTRFNQGEGFRKTWRVKNTGSCTWTSDYTFTFVSGDQMSGRMINIPGNVAPNQTVDLSIDLIAPYADGKYKGYWQMRSPQGSNFGETIWVQIQVGGGGSNPSPTQAPSGGSINIEYFYPDYYSGSAGDCVRAYWKANGASMVEVTADGVSLYRGDVVAPGSLKLCGPLTEGGDHYVQLHAWNRTAESYSSFKYSTSYSPDGQWGDGPTIYYFYVSPDEGHMGDTATVFWGVSDNTSVVYIYVDGNLITESRDTSGAAPVQATIQSVGKHQIQLVARNVITDATQTVTYTMRRNKK